jgi:predicted RNase H-like nuclease (RuvC/YqgF family)
MDDNAMNKIKEELLMADCGATVAGDVAQTRNSGKAEIPSPAGRISSHDSDALDTDTTVDLSEPHSQSGRYWKSEYERYQEDAREQMKKLVRYKQLAKSYAKMKDEEALGLSQKLKEEKDKVAQMEDKIAELVAHLQGKGPAESYEVPPELFQDLARQTALAVQYRNHVDRFESTLRKHDKSLSTNARASAPRAVNEKSVRSAPPQQPENHDAMNQLHLEMQALRNQLSAVERKASKLQDHNAALTKDLAKMSLDSSRREERRQTAEKSLSVKDDQLQALQKKYDNLKESAKAQRRDAVYLLKKKHDQVSELRKEIVSLKGVVKSHEKENIRPPMTLKDIT